MLNLVLIEGVLFNVKYLGETQSDCDGRGDKEDRIAQADMAANEVRVSYPMVERLSNSLVDH